MTGVKKEIRMKITNSLNFAFKVLEGIAKVNAEAPDMEEAQEVDNA